MGEEEAPACKELNPRTPWFWRGSSEAFFESLPSVGRECCMYCLQPAVALAHTLRPGSCSSPERG